ncbi:hypothetical protein PV08_10597 [Exophiala spinifera]|uniref:Uncharacterized protein n=1 Tax=Exophiala spinifera TaxID=91928 RepID=A0A0D1ZE59_9EURO|nr:uncharacterized protein PV08_10597 [Exophiala spinifera]KIW11297.1 hypothetical protein PV08_10597 [Exophiala spinifera]
MEVSGSARLTRVASYESLPPFDETGRLDLEAYAYDDINRLFSRFLTGRNKGPKTSQFFDEAKASSTLSRRSETPPPPLNVLVQLIGSRGDIQPFIALGIHLKRYYGHRVRIATHGVFQNLVERNGLLFFDIGGDPEQLMSFMVRNPGLLPSYKALRAGEIKQHRQTMYKMWKLIWRSCFENGPDGTPFVADLIIANPPSFAHIHCAERLGIPLHLMFTMPYSPSGAFPHPLTRVGSDRLNNSGMNRLSYYIVEWLVWLGLGDDLNRFRQNVLHLQAINLSRAPNQVTKLKIPHTYCWSPSLLPKPSDWGEHISVAGYFTLDDQDPSFDPPPGLCKFLESREPPIYIGFGSIVVDNPERLTELVLHAVKLAGVRALISKGWLGLGDDIQTSNENVYSISDVPHSWLFEHVSAVVHHGGAGTTAASLRAGKPSVVVPFFGDQHFWGQVVYTAGCGPKPIPFLQLTPEKLASQISAALEPVIKAKAAEVGATIKTENGCEAGARTLHNALDFDASRCQLTRDRIAVWETRGSYPVRMSALAAAALEERGHLRYSQLRLLRHGEYEMEDRPTDPLSGGAFAVLGSCQEIVEESYNLSKNIARAASSRNARTEIENVKEGVGSNQDRDDAKKSTSGRQSSSGHNNDIDGNANVPAGSKDVGSSQILKSAGHLSKAIASIPMDFCLGMARGFQNIPIAYGDKSQRSRPKVSGVLTGVTVGVKELVFGLYDGVTGVATQPIQGYKENNIGGLVAGVGKGLGGLILKPGAGICGLPGYALQGLSQEIHKAFGENVESRIALARALQGREELQSCSAIERDNIVGEWKRTRGLS